MNIKGNKNFEFNHFENMADEWWKPNGKLKVLHSITPIRINYIIKNIGLSTIVLNKKKQFLQGLDVLDLGCGGGLVCEPLSRLGANVTGIDFVKKNIENAINHAKLSGLKISYTTQDLLNIKLNKKFNIILMLEIIEHIDDWQKVIKKIINYLKPRGRIIFASINRTLLAKIFAIYIAEEILKWVPRNTHDFNKLVKPEELQDFLEMNNMRVINITGLIFNPILREWNLSDTNSQINYFCSAELIN